MENWAAISGFEGYYEVSDLGRVRSLERTIWCKRGDGYWRTISPRLLRPGKCSNGYLAVGLDREGKKKTAHVHILVATAYHGDRPSNQDCMHIDGDKSNNSASNFRWGTRSENIKQNWDDGKMEHVRSRVAVPL